MDRLTIWALIWMASALLSSVSATTYVVQPDGGGDFPTIQAAIDAVLDGDVIELTDGIFMGPGNRDIDFLGKAITVGSQSGNAESCIIDCDGSPEEPHRGFVFQSGESPSSVLSAVTIRGGYGLNNEHGRSNGGALYCVSESCPSLISCVFTENSAEIGGGVACRHGSDARFVDCTFSSNDTWNIAGGMYCAYSSPSIVGCLFSGNYAVWGCGGLHGFQSSPEIIASTFAANSCSTGYSGGADFFHSCSPTIIGCSFIGNVGGAVSSDYYSSLTLNSCTFYDNQQSDTQWGAVAVLMDSYALLDNTIIAFSYQLYGVYCGPTSGAALLRCCDVYGNDRGDWVDCIAGQEGMNGNICEDPLFCNAAEGDLRLQEDSPCAPFSPPNPECDLIGAWPVGCWSGVDEGSPAERRAPLVLIAPSLFTPPVEIAYRIPGGTGTRRVACRVLDPTGRLVRTLVEALQPPGRYVFSWNGSDERGRPVGSGVYLLELTAGGNALSQRVVLLR
jgi:hypothetical protein